jgi:hypothetical protein
MELVDLDLSIGFGGTLHRSIRLRSAGSLGQKRSGARAAAR